MNRLAPILALVLLTALGGCSGSADEPVEAVSATEAQALDDAAAMLEQRRLPPDAVAKDGAADEAATDQPAEGEDSP